MGTRSSLKALGLLVCVCAASGAWAVDIYVDGDAPGANNGTSWVNAYRYLQDALAVAQPGDTIKVAQGVYKPDQATGPVTGGRAATFRLATGVAVLGGFAGYGLPPWPSDDRNTLLYPSVLSGDLSGNDTSVDPCDSAAVDAILTHATRQDNCYSVVTASYTNLTAILDGFTILGGIANGASQKRGGGLLCVQGSPTIRNCVVKVCAASERGGGMYVSGGDPNVAQCSFVANYATTYGGGLSSQQGRPGLVECTFENNRVGDQGRGGGVANDDSNSVVVGTTFKYNYAGRGGGGLHSLGSDPNIVGCEFIRNESRMGGGGLEGEEGSHMRVTRSSFIRNLARFGSGGGVRSKGGTARLVSCRFVANETRSEGGAVNSDAAVADLINCLFSGNVAQNYGGGVACAESDVGVINCTFSANTAAGGDAVACSSVSPPETRSTVVVVNSILWDSGSEIYNNDGSSVGVTYSTLYGSWPGVGNLSANPRFLDLDGPDGDEGTEDDDLTLKDYSPCIDAGSNAALPVDILTDLAGKTRRIDDPDTSDEGSGQPPLVDMGAYEYGTDMQGQHPPVAHAGQDRTVYASGGGTASVVLDGSGSYDPDGSPLTYTWTWMIGTQIHQATGVQPAVTLPIGEHYIDLVVFDGTHSSDPDAVRILVLQMGGLPPVANAGPDRTVSTTPGGYASVQLNGSGSYDPEGSPLTYSWTWATGAATGVQPTVQLPAGVHAVDLIVYDGSLYSNPDTVLITVVEVVNQAPVANAGPDRTVTATAGGYASVQLNGSGSYDPEGSPLTYAWTWTVGPQPYSATGVSPTVQLPVGVHVITLIVHDGSLYSTPDTVQITVLQPTNQAPIANAGPDRTVTATGGGYASVQLNGSGSYDPEGSPLTYSWTWTIGAQTYSATGVGPTVQLPVGTHIVTLVVHDGSLFSAPDTVQIVVQAANQPPVANAGPDRTVTATAGGYASVQLNGSGSYDPEGSPLTYGWTWTIGAQTYSATGVGPTVQLPVGTHSVRLIVFDGSLYSNPDTVQIVVQAVNQAPVANAGPDRTVTATGGGYASVQMNGSGSYDPEGSPLTYSWTWTIGAQTYSATGVGPTIQLPVGTHSVRLIVFDGSLYSNPDTAQIVVQAANQAPIANAGPDQTVTATAGGNASVQLNGSSSYDPEGSPLTYSWTWTIGSQSYSSTVVSPTVQLPVGTHTIRLVVYDGSVYSNQDTVQITVLQPANQAPVANAGPDRTVYATAGGYASVQLDGSGSYDPEGSPLAYTWIWTVGSQSYYTTTANPTLQLPVGTYSIRLTVFDGSLYSTPDYVQITVLQIVNQAPIANAGPDRTGTALVGGYASIQLDGSASYDPDGGPLTYTWTWTIGPQSFSATGVSPTVQLPVGTHNIQLIVFDGSLYSNPDTVQVTILQTGGQPPVANAGADRTVSALGDGFASVQLDGSGSYDPDGGPLQYTWTWTLGAQTHQSIGVQPTVQLPVGVHTIELVVFDGTYTSAPDYVVIHVVSPQEYPTWVWPFDVNRGDTDEYVVVLLTLPTIPVADVDLTVPIACYPGGVQAVAQHATEHTDEQGLITMVFALFEEEDLFDAIPQDGLVEVTVVGRLLSGDWFSGTAQVALTH